MSSGRQPIRPLPVILPPLTDELLSSWINRHAAFIGVSGMRLLRHYRIDVPTVRDLDLEMSHCDGSKLAEALRCLLKISSDTVMLQWCLRNAGGAHGLAMAQSDPMSGWGARGPCYRMRSPPPSSGDPAALQVEAFAGRSVESIALGLPVPILAAMDRFDTRKVMLFFVWVSIVLEPLVPLVPWFYGWSQFDI